MLRIVRGTRYDSVMSSDPPGYEQVLLGLAEELTALAARGPQEVASQVQGLLDNRSGRAVSVRLRMARAAALNDLVAQLGTAYAVARLLGVAETTVSGARRPRRPVS